MKIVFLTRTSRPSGALVASQLIQDGKDVVAIVAEERSELLKKKGGIFSVLSHSLKRHGFRFTIDRIIEVLLIKLHYFLRKSLPRGIFRSNGYLSVEELVIARPVPYFVVKDHNSVEAEKLIRSFAPDLIVVTNTRLLCKNILGIPGSGCLNLHLSELPKYAGLNSIFWALYHGEKEIGVTVHYMAELLDKGDIVTQRMIRIDSDDDERSLYAKAIELGAAMMSATVTRMERDIVIPIKQDESLASYFTWPTKAERKALAQKLKRRRKIAKDRPLKILHIITRLVKGGAQENTILTVMGLRTKGYDAVLASGPTYGQEGELESHARRMKTKLVIIPELVRDLDPWKDLVCLVKLANFIRRHRFDVVHTHTSKAGIIGRVAAKLAGVPIIVHTPHGHIFHSYFGEFRTRFFRLIEIISSRFCDRIITLTDKCKEEHIGLRIAPPDKFVTIHSGVRVERFVEGLFDREKIKEELHIPPDRKVVGTVARLEPIKGIKYLVESMREVLDAVPDVHFLIVGDGSQRKIYEERTRTLGIEEHVTFTGIREDVPRYISVMDLFVLPSLNEGMGRVLVEAGVMGKAVVATKVSGIPELVEHSRTGILVEPANSGELSRGIIELLSDPEKARSLGANARTRLADNYSAQRMVDKIEKLYKDLM